MMKGMLVAALLGLITAVPSTGMAQEPQVPAGGQAKPPELGATLRIPEPERNRRLPNQTLRAGDIENRDIHTLRGERLGSVRRIVLDVTDGRTFIVLEHGDLYGLGEKEFPLPVERVVFQGSRLVTAGLTEAELRAVADWDVERQKYRELADSEMVNVRQR